MMLGGGTVYGGGSWTCQKCGQTIYGSSINHDCRNSVWVSIKRATRKLRIKRIFKRIAKTDGKIS
jgi:ribosomal protein L37AE/L43A